MHLDDLLPHLIRPKKYKDYISCVCPFHDDDKPSLLVFEDGWFQCLACEARGDHERLYNKLQGMPIRYTPQEHTEWRAPALPYDPELLACLAFECHYTLKEREHLGWYWKMRGVAGQIELAKLGWYNGWYTIPVFGFDKELLRLILRAGPHIQRQSGLRYHNSPGKPILYVPSWRRFEKATTIAVVYGMIDALALSELDYPVVTVTAGKEQFKAEWIWDARKELQKGKCRIVIIPDLKEEATAKKLERELDPYATVLQLPYVEDGMRDPADYLVAGKEKLLHRRLAGKF